MVSTGLEELDKILGAGGYPDRSAILITGPPGVGKEALGYLLYSVFFVVTVGYVTAVMSVAVSRSSDATLKGHMRWFAYFLLAVIGYSLIFPIGTSLGFTGSETNSLGFFVFTPATYFLYRMAKSLAPTTGKLDVEENITV